MKMITKRADGSKRVYTVNNEPSKTDQQWKKDCDVNEVMKKFKRTGQITHLAKKQGHFSDISEIPDLLAATKHINDAMELFSELDSATRKKFNNNPTELYEFLMDSKNDEEAIKLGLKLSPEDKSKEIVPSVQPDPK